MGTRLAVKPRRFKLPVASTTVEEELVRNPHWNTLPL